MAPKRVNNLKRNLFRRDALPGKDFNPLGEENSHEMESTSSNKRILASFEHEELAKELQEDPIRKLVGSVDFLEDGDDIDPIEEQIFSTTPLNLNRLESSIICPTKSSSSAISTPSRTNSKATPRTTSSTRSNCSDESSANNIIHIPGPVEMKDLIIGKVNILLSFLFN
jgi:hypothetical protein